MTELFITCNRGCSGILAQEIESLGANIKQVVPTGVRCEHADPQFFMRANVMLRSALRVFIPIIEGKIDTPEQLYKLAKEIRWDKYLTKNAKFRVDAFLNDTHPRINNSMFAALKVKDAIADWFRDRFGRRPDVSKNEPDLIIRVTIHRGRAELFINTSGDSLHKRGYRIERTAAPMNESLAASLILMSEWDGSTPFYDLMCGSGTLGIEAALIANRTDPGLLRDRYGFLSWARPDLKGYDAIIAERQDQERIEGYQTIYVNDIDTASVDIAEKNARRAGVHEQIIYFNKTMFEIDPISKNGTIILNPPYGKRIGGDTKRIKGMFNRIEQVFREKWSGFRLCVLFPEETYFKQFRMTPESVYPVTNADIDCTFAVYDIR